MIAYGKLETSVLVRFCRVLTVRSCGFRVTAAVIGLSTQLFQNIIKIRIRIGIRTIVICSALEMARVFLFLFFNSTRNRYECVFSVAASKEKKIKKKLRY